MNWMTLSFVAAGGALGASLRYIALSLIPATAFPFGTLGVNVLGAFILGILMELSALHLNLGGNMRAFLAVGVLGGFTTFSAFALDAVYLIQKEAFVKFGLYVSASVFCAIAGLLVGMFLVKYFLS